MDEPARQQLESALGLIPQYMAVIVSSSITQNGSVISGNIAIRIIVVKTNPGCTVPQTPVTWAPAKVARDDLRRAIRPQTEPPPPAVKLKRPTRE